MKRNGICLLTGMVLFSGVLFQPWACYGQPEKISVPSVGIKGKEEERETKLGNMSGTEGENEWRNKRGITRGPEWEVENEHELENDKGNETKNEKPAHSPKKPQPKPSPPKPKKQNITLTPPNVRVYLEGTQFYEGREMMLDVEVTWPTEVADYEVRPPEFELPSGLERVSTSSSSDSGKQGLLTYRFGIMVKQAGRYKISPVKVGYIAAGAEEAAILEVEGVSFNAVTYTWYGLKPKYWWMIGGSAVLVLTLSGWLLIMQKRRRERIQSDPANQQKAQVLQLISLCKKHKKDSRYNKFFETAEAAYKAMGVEDISGNIGPIVDKIRFGEYNPTPEEADKAYRELENTLKDIFPDQEEAWE